MKFNGYFWEMQLVSFWDWMAICQYFMDKTGDPQFYSTHSFEQSLVTSGGHIQAIFYVYPVEIRISEARAKVFS